MALIMSCVTLIRPSERRLQVQVLLWAPISFEAYRFVLSDYCSTITVGLFAF